MEVIATIIICATCIFALILLIQHGLPAINIGIKVTHVMEQQGVMDIPLPDATQVDLEQENLSKEHKIQDLAEAINLYLNGGDLK